MFVFSESEFFAGNDAGLDIVQDAVFDGFAAGISFDAAVLTAAAGIIFEVREFAMTDFTADVIGTEHEFAVGDETAADTGTDVNGEDAGDGASCAEVVFAPGNGVEVVGDFDFDIGSHAGDGIFNGGVEIDVVPVEIRGVENGVFVDGDLTGDGDAEAREIGGVNAGFSGDGGDDLTDDFCNSGGGLSAANGVVLGSQGFERIR